MKKLAVLSLLALTLPTTALAVAEATATVRGVYVEARSAQVFIGGCVANSEFETAGREAVLAWRIERGETAGVSLDGLAVVAAVAGTENLGLGTDSPRSTVLYIDGRGTPEQREALASLYLERHGELFGDVVAVIPAPIAFSEAGDGFRVTVASDVAVQARPFVMDDSHLKNGGCGAAQWYEPFVELDSPTIGITTTHRYQGPLLDARWSDPEKQSAFFGTFSY